MSIQTHNIQFLQSKASLFQGCLRGVERECLRVDANSNLARTPHYSELGSALTHPFITTDFSESLLEFITAPHASIEAMLDQLNEIHCFTASHIGDELFWSSSMPSFLPSDKDIPIARYGHSNAGTMKSIYRKGLSNRYGSSMQMVAGIHYNYSIAPAVWSELRWKEQSFLSLQDYTTQGYFRMIRNFKRWYWLLIYLFGAAPAVGSSFVENKQHNLVSIPDCVDTLYHSYGTSLRLGNLGYQSSVQDDLTVSYNNLPTYIRDLLKVLNESYHGYEIFSSSTIANESSRSAIESWQQLSAAILQIENEFYSVIRPKQTARSGETQLKALWNRGVEYIEVRCLDINPFEPLGISAQQAAVVEVFLLTCLLYDSPDLCTDEVRCTLDNQKLVVEKGREPNLRLKRKDADGNLSKVLLSSWSSELFESMEVVAKLLDSASANDSYLKSLMAFKPMINEPKRTLSHQTLDGMQSKGLNYIDWVNQQSKQFTDYFKQQQLSPLSQAHFDSIAKKSLIKQSDVEQQDSLNFSEFIRDYYQQYQSQNFQ